MFETLQTCNVGGWDGEERQRTSELLDLNTLSQGWTLANNITVRRYQVVYTDICTRKTIQITPFQQHTIFSNTEMCGVVFFFFFCIFVLQYGFFQLKNSFSFFCQFRSIFLFLYIQKCDTSKFEFVAETGGC